MCFCVDVDQSIECQRIQRAHIEKKFCAFVLVNGANAMNGVSYKEICRKNRLKMRNVVK